MARRGVVQIIIAARDMTAQALTRLRASLASIKNAAFSVQGALAGLGVVLGGGAFLRALVSTNRQFERLLAQLHTVQGSAEAGRAAFNAIEQLAARTPFQIEELTQAFILLRALGTRPMERELLALGDLASSFGRNITDVAAAIRSAAAGEAEPLKMLGFQMKTTGDQVELAFRGMTRTVRRDAGSILEAVTEIAESNFGGAMDREMATLNGAISNLQDNLGTLMRAIGEAGLTGELMKLVSWLRDLAARIGENRAAVAAWTVGIISAIKAVLVTLLETVRGAFNVGQAIGDAIASGLNQGMGLIAAFVNFVTGRINWLIAQLDRIPGVNIDFRIGRLPPDRFFDSARGHAGAVTENLGQVLGGLQRVGNAWLDIARNASSAADAARDATSAGASLAPPGTGAGTVPETMDQRLTRLGGAAGRTIEAHRLGLITDAQFRARLDELVPALQRIRDGLQADETQAIAAAEAIDKLREAAVALAQSESPNDPDAARGGLFRELGRALTDMFGDAESFNDLMVEITTTTMRGFGDAVRDSFMAFASGSRSAGDAFRDSMLGSLSAVARALGEFYLGKALAALGEGLLFNPAGFAAAAKFTAAAAAMFAVSGSLAGIGSRGGGAGAASAAESAAAENTSSRGRTTVIFPQRFLDTADPEVRRTFQELFRDLADTGTVEFRTT